MTHRLVGFDRWALIHGNEPSVPCRAVLRQPVLSMRVICAADCDGSALYSSDGWQGQPNSGPIRQIHGNRRVVRVNQVFTAILVLLKRRHDCLASTDVLYHPIACVIRRSFGG